MPGSFPAGVSSAPHLRAGDMGKSSNATTEGIKIASGESDCKVAKPFLPDLASDLKHLLEANQFEHEQAGGRTVEAFQDPLLQDILLRHTPPPQAWDPLADNNINQFESNIQVFEDNKRKECSYLQKDKQKATYSKVQHPGQSVGKLSSQYLSSSSDVRFACPDHHSAWHASSSHLATMQEETCQSAQSKESLVIPRSLASPMGLNHFHKSQDTATAGPSQPQFHAIDANHAWSSIRAPLTNGWKKEQCQPSPLSNPHQSDRQRKFLEHVRGRCLNCLSTDHRVATCCRRTRCWRCLNEGHKSFSCPRRRPHHHNRIEEDHDLLRRGPVDDFYNSMGRRRGRGDLHGSPPPCSSPLSPPFMCTGLHKEALFALTHGNDYGYNRKMRKITKHVTFATPLFKVCNDELPTLYDDSSFLFLGNASTPGQSIYSCDPMLFESHISMSPITIPCSTSSPSVQVESRILKMLEAAADCAWFTPTVDATSTMEDDQVTLFEREKVPLSIQEGTTGDAPEEVQINDSIKVFPPPLEEITDHLVHPRTNEKIEVTKELLVYRRRKKSVSEEEHETRKSHDGNMVPSPTPQEVHVAATPLLNKATGLQDSEQAVQTQSLTRTPIVEKLPRDIMSIEQFIDHITLPISAPLLQLPLNLSEYQMAEQTQTPTRTETVTMQDSQRKSCRLAEKAKRTPGKNSMQLAQDVVAKKLGDPSPSSTDASSSDEFNHLAQYLDRPLTKQSMEALTALIEHGQPKKVKKTQMRVA